MLTMLTSCASLPSGKTRELSDGQKEQLLRQRVQAIWDATVRQDRSTVYDMLDPFFRVKVDKSFFLAMKGFVTYFDTEIKAVEVKGNVARAAVRVEYETRGLHMHGKEVKPERKETVTMETWLFIDGNWYREFVDNLSETSVAKY
jgi:hypothetical protein